MKPKIAKRKENMLKNMKRTEKPVKIQTTNFIDTFVFCEEKKKKLKIEIIMVSM